LFQKWILLSSNVDESSYSQTSYEDSSTDFNNQSVLEHTYSTDTDDIQQSSVKRHRLSTHSSVYDDNFTLNETVNSSCTSPLLSKKACMLNKNFYLFVFKN